MTETERRQSEERRKLIAGQTRAANRHRPVRVIAPADRADELLAGMGVTVDDDRPVDWAALTRG